MNWISVKDFPFPEDGDNYLALVKGQFALLCWDEEKQKYSMFWMPNAYEHIWEFSKEEWGKKITHWAKLVYPEDY